MGDGAFYANQAIYGWDKTPIEGDRVGVGHRRGDSMVHASRFAHMQRGVVIIESVWPNGAHEEGLGVNALIGADAAPPLGGAVYHDAAFDLYQAGDSTETVSWQIVTLSYARILPDRYDSDVLMNRRRPTPSRTL